MRIVPEYDLNNPATWTVVRERDVWSEREADEFQKALIGIAGLNPFGEPNLVIRWSVSYLDPQMPDGRPKYYLSTNEPVLVACEFTEPETGEKRRVKTVDEVPASVLITLPVYEETHLGERRFIVEVWRSAEFLARTGRYRDTFDTGERRTFISCRNCGGEMRETGREDERVCVSCGSHRQSIVEEREVFTEKLLNDLPERGTYDFFMRLERDGRMALPDNLALREIREEWGRSLRPFAVKDAEIREGRQKAEADKRRRIRGVWAAV
jgi:hypothetical protein